MSLPPDWQLPRGVTRSLWEFVLDPQIPRTESEHLSNSPLLEFDRQTIANWLPEARSLLDLGCGTGRIAIDIARRGKSVVGVDLSTESLKVAQELANAADVSISLLRANLCDLSCLADRSFDAALLMFGTLGMIAGAKNRQQALREAHRLLKPGGKLALHVHNVWRHLFAKTGRWWFVQDLWRRLVQDPNAGDTLRGYRGIPNMYHHTFTSRELQWLLSDTGFELIESIPLSPVPDLASPAAGTPPPDLTFRGWFPDIQATGWLALAQRRE